MKKYIFLVVENESNIISAHRTREGAEAAKEELRAYWPNVVFWIDILSIKD